MQAGFLLVVCLSVVVMLATTSMTQTVTPTPMSCSSDGNITYKAPTWVKSAKSSCGLAVVNTTNNIIVIKGCTERTSVTVDMFNMTSAPTTQWLTANVTTVIVSCTHSSVYPVGVTLPGRVAVIPTKLTAAEAISLKMSLTEHGNQHQATTVVIGAQYDLHITGAGDHYMQIKTCSADVDSDMRNSVPVYDVAHTSEATLGIITPAASGTGTGTAHPLKATLTGFRLVKSPFVYLKCDVKVCDKACPDKAKRKRTKSNLKSVSITFEVMGTQSARSANGVRDMHSAGKITVATVMVLFARYFSF